MNVTKIKPTFNRVLVKKLTEEKTEGGLFIPITAEEGNIFQAEVVAIGKEVTGFDVGETVLVGKFSGIEVEMNTAVFLLNEKDILAIIG